MRLRAHLNEIKADDIEIQKFGIDELTDDEMRSACRARGMPAPFGKGCTSYMRKQLGDWIELSLDKYAAAGLSCRHGANLVLCVLLALCVTCSLAFSPVVLHACAQLCAHQN
jgi:LETM1-like protein